MRVESCKIRSRNFNFKRLHELYLYADLQYIYLSWFLGELILKDIETSEKALNAVKPLWERGDKTKKDDVACLEKVHTHTHPHIHTLGYTISVDCSHTQLPPSLPLLF